MIRRFIFDVKQDRVVEIEANGRSGANAREEYQNTLNEYKRDPAGHSEMLRKATLNIADRREWAQRRRGDENRFD